MPCFEASALNDNGESLALLRAVLDGSGRTGHPTWTPSWTRAGHHSLRHSGPDLQAGKTRGIPPIIGVPVPVSAAYGP
jgi:hypothetical protein